MIGRAAVLFVLLPLVVGAFAASAASDEYEPALSSDSNNYQWAELSDESSSSSPAFVELSSSEGTSAEAASEASAAEEEFKHELIELRAAFDIDAIIEGRQHEDAEHDAALLEMEITSALVAEATPADFFRFARSHSRLYATEKAAAAAFAAFKQNKKAAAEMNALLGITSESEAVFAATGPLSSLSPAAFKSKILTAKNPRGKSRGKRVRISKGASADTKKSPLNSAVNNKSRAIKPKPGANGALQPQVGGGHRAGIAGGAGGMSGKTGGQSGKTGGQSGKTGGQSGKTGGQSGKTGGQSGKTGGQSGKTGGKSGKQGGKSGKVGGDSGSSAKKSGKTGGGGIVHSSVANGTIALPGQQSKQARISPLGYTDPKLAARYGLSAQSLKQEARSRGSIGELAYSQVYETMKRPHNVRRAAAYNAQKHFLPIEPIQSNDCGSCWAIAAQQSMQRYWTQANFGGVLSVQQLLDCIRTTDSNGCRGGTPMDAFTFWATNIAATETDYPTVMKDQQCKKPPYVKSFFGYPSGGWEMLVPECIPGGTENIDCRAQIKYELMAVAFTRQAGFQPPIAYVDASQWQNYRGGVFPPSMCKSTMEAGNHVVQIIGSGVDNMGIPYWTLDNFWGESWGEGGRIRVPFGVNACGLFNFAIYATPPPFYKPGSSANNVPDPNAKPVPYDPKPIQLQKVDPSGMGAIGKTAATIKAFAPVVQGLGAGFYSVTPKSN